MKKKIAISKLVAIFCFIVMHINLLAQDAHDVQKALSLVKKNADAIGLSKEDIINSRVSDTYEDVLSGSTLVYLQQTHEGIDVDRVIQVLAFKNDKLVSASGKRLGFDTQVSNAVKEKRVISPSVSIETAIQAAANHLKLPAPFFSFKSVPNRNFTKATDFGDMGIAKEKITARLLWISQKGSGRTDLVWEVNLSPKKSADSWRVIVDAKTGLVLRQENYTVYDNWQKENRVPGRRNNVSGMPLTIINDYENENKSKVPQRIASISYRVVPFPAEVPFLPGGAPALVSDPWLLSPIGSGATPFNWNNDGLWQYKFTRGNNVLAQADPYGFSDPLITAKGTVKKNNLFFDFKPDFNTPPTDSINQSFAITNLFYWTNILHDLSYQYGFDEVSGNFQRNNFGRGGKGNDFVVTYAQHPAFLSSAGFGNGPDGSGAVLYMGLNSNTLKGATINAPASIAGYLTAKEGALSDISLTNIGPVTGDVTLYNEAQDTLHLACDVAVNELKGKIALINRGTCYFTDKILNAQNAGALAVIVIDSVPGETPYVMGGYEPAIIIPAVMIGFEDGLKIKNALYTGSSVNITLSPPAFDDLSLDNGTICHEYGHGISSRLVGGPSTATCLLNNDVMHEGWSDYIELMAVTDWRKANKNDGRKAKTVGPYDNGVAGRRRYPFSTDMNINPLTYADVPARGGEFHEIGDIWSTALWDMTWGLIQTDGINKNIFNSNKAGGNSVSFKLVMMGMKLHPCGSVGFLDGRDAILKADTLLFNGSHSCTIWNAFARRGMGLGAVQGIPDTVDFNVGAIYINPRANKKTVSAGDKINYTIGLKANAVCGGRVPQNYTVTDTLPANVIYVSSDGFYNPVNRTVTYRNIDMNKGDSLTFKLQVKVKRNASFRDSVYLDDPTTGPAISDDWVTQNGQYLSWTRYYDTTISGYISNDASTKDEDNLITANKYLVPGIKTTFSFYHSFNTDNSYNGGVVEITADDGKTWQDLGPHMDAAGVTYTETITANSELSGRRAFTGSGNGITTIDLSTFAGKKVKIRFRYATSDDSFSNFGWYLANILFSATPIITNTFRLINSKNELKRSSVIITKIKSSTVVSSDFKVEKQNEEALLSWSTNSETDKSIYQIERSTDKGATFKSIGNVNSIANSEDLQAYTFTDVAPLEGTNFYRIKHINANGIITYSEVRSLLFEGAKGVTVFPNPAKNRIKVSIPGNDKTVQLKFTDVSGKLIKTYTMIGQYAELKLPALPPGAYYLNVIRSGIISKHKLIIE